MKPVVHILFICLTGFTYLAQSQDVDNILKTISPRKIQSISPANEDFSDLQFLKEVLRNNRIVLLGEQSHGEGATFEAKVRLIKFLHQELNYEIVSFESGLYDNYKTFENIKDSIYRESPLKESIFSIWSDAKEFEPLLKYVHDRKNSTKPLMVTGFDCQADDIFKEQFLDDVKSVLGTNTTFSEEENRILDEVISAGPEFIVSNENDSSLFFTTCNKIQTSLEKLKDFKTNHEIKVLRQSLISWVETVKWEIDLLNEVPVKVQNPRDLQMAKNLIFLSELYPEKKIIGWGASYHFANQIELYRNTPLTASFIHKYDSVQKSEEPTDLNRDLAGAIPMGRILKDYFGTALYSISFSSFEGEFGMLGSNPISMNSIKPPNGSIEFELNARGNDFAFIDYHQLKVGTTFYSSALGNLPIFAPWQLIFDALFFIKTSYPPSFPKSEITINENPVSKNVFSQPKIVTKSGVKQLIDRETKIGIGYANIYLLNSSKGVASNAEGEFIFNIPQTKRTDKIIISSIGYKTDTLLVHQFIKVDKIELTPISTLLGAIEIRSKPLRAKDIIKLAERRIGENYYQDANQQEFFYRVKKYQEDSVVFNEEAAVLVYNPIGYNSSNNATKKLKGKILQFRNTTNNDDNRDTWAGVGSLWLVYTHDLILDKDNVLHRPAYYDLTLNGITMYEGQKVYDISFDCKKPGAYTTGFGYPAPISASGKIFIDVDTYSVLKIETLIQRQSYKSKRRPNLLIDPYGHQLIQSYKIYEGKYFLNYSKQIYFSKWINTKTNYSARNLEIRELLSTDIIPKPTEYITVPLTNIKSVQVNEDPYFWVSHNIKVEDSVLECYKLLELPKREK